MNDLTGAVTVLYGTDQLGRRLDGTSSKATQETVADQLARFVLVNWIKEESAPRVLSMQYRLGAELRSAFRKE